MSRQADERKYRAGSKNGQNGPTKRKSTYVVYRPNTEERTAVRADKSPLSDVVLRLIEWTQRDAKIVIGFRAENESHFVHLTDLSVDWQEALTLSVFHSDAETALRTLDHGLRSRYSGFPDIQMDLFPDDTTW